MDHKGEQGEQPPQGNEWEVISLTASAYAASPGPDNVELKDSRKSCAYQEEEASNALFMSDHFVFPPSKHENLPIETFLYETNDNTVSKDLGPLFATDEMKHVDENDSTVKGADFPGEPPGTRVRDEMAKEEQSVHGESILGSILSETVSSGATVHDQESLYVESNQTPEGSLLHSDASNPLRPAKDFKDAAYNLPCEAWWRRRAVSAYSHAKEANAFWSLLIAAAVTGLVILRQHWQQERWQVLQLKWQSSISNERLSRVLGPLTRLKDAIVGGNQQASFITSGSLGEI